MTPFCGFSSFTLVRPIAGALIMLVQANFVVSIKAHR